MLSFAGRIQLIRSVLSAMYLYWASVFLLPKGVIRDIESRLRKFLWKGTTDIGVAKVAWEVVCRPKEQVGLGIQPVLPMNQALMCKHLWELLSNQGGSIWARWIKQNRLRTKSVWQVSHGTGSWGWKQILKLRAHILPALQYQVGNGNTFLLWQDPWHPRGVLINRYPRGPLLTGLHEGSQIQAVIHDGHWRWPSATTFEIMEIIESLPPIFPDQPDMIKWKLRGGKFNTASALQLFTPQVPKVKWHYLLSGPLKIPRNSFTLWLAIQHKLSTLDKPWLQNITNTCILCQGTARETHQHLFFDCPYSMQCLRICQQEVKFQWPHSDWNRAVDWASSRYRGSHLLNASYRALLCSLVYHLWNERNMRRFQQHTRDPSVLAHLVLDQIRNRIICKSTAANLQVLATFRIWKIA